MRSQNKIPLSRCTSSLVVQDNMDIPTLLKNLRDEVSCPVCQNIFKDPRHLSCQHSFCLECLQNWHRASGGGNAITCPKCRTLSTIPTSYNLKDLPKSFYLNGFIDMLAIKECNTTQVTCRNCNKKSSEASYCFQCCKFYCEQCLIAHNMMLDYKEHRVLAVKEFQDRDYVDVLKRPAFCSKPRHEKEELKFFCEKCKMAVCQTCITHPSFWSHLRAHRIRSRTTKDGNKENGRNTETELTSENEHN